MSASRNHQIEVISKMWQIVETLREARDGLTLHALAAQTGQVKSSIHRILRTLAHHGYVEQTHRGGAYRLGVKFLSLAAGVREGLNLVELTRPFARELKDRFDESTYIAVLRAREGVFVDVQETHRDLRLVGPLGARVHFHATAAGKIMAAYFPEPEQQKLLRATPHARNIWQQTRELGYGINDEETIPGAVFIAGPLFDTTIAICGSISLGIPKHRYTDALRQRLPTEVRACCDRASRALAAAHYVHLNAFTETATGAFA
jgi:DNA-binding IclR family transcriptional regulator